MSSRRNSSLLNKRPLPARFYRRPTTEVARDLLGKGLVIGGKNPLICELTEVEAYLGFDDAACHASRGKTKRNEMMFSVGGVCYVYLIYGMYFCVNVVTEEAGIGSAVLLRSARPILGEETMRRNRRLSEAAPAGKILSGPGKLCTALGIDRSFNGRKFNEPSLKIIDLGANISEHQISASPRIGISMAQEALLRFCIKDSLWLSRKG